MFTNVVNELRFPMQNQTWLRSFSVNGGWLNITEGADIFRVTITVRMFGKLSTNSHNVIVEQQIYGYVRLQKY